MHYFLVKPSCWNFRVITANFQDVWIFRVFTVVEGLWKCPGNTCQEHWFHPSHYYHGNERKKRHTVNKQDEWATSWQYPTKWSVCPAKTQISLGIHPVWSESLLSAFRKLGSLAIERTAKALIRLGGCPGWSEPLLGTHASLLVLSRGGSNSKLINTFLILQCSYRRLDERNEVQCITRKPMEVSNQRQTGLLRYGG